METDDHLPPARERNSNKVNDLQHPTSVTQSARKRPRFSLLSADQDVTIVEESLEVLPVVRPAKQRRTRAKKKQTPGRIREVYSARDDEPSIGLLDVTFEAVPDTNKRGRGYRGGGSSRRRRPPNRFSQEVKIDHHDEEAARKRHGRRRGEGTHSSRLGAQYQANVLPFELEDTTPAVDSGTVLWDPVRAQQRSESQIGQ